MNSLLQKEWPSFPAEVLISTTETPADFCLKVWIFTLFGDKSLNFNSFLLAHISFGLIPPLPAAVRHQRDPAGRRVCQVVSGTERPLSFWFRPTGNSFYKNHSCRLCVAGRARWRLVRDGAQADGKQELSVWAHWLQLIWINDSDSQTTKKTNTKVNSPNCTPHKQPKHALTSTTQTREWHALVMSFILNMEYLLKF